ncbi:MAG: diguanylate cyclase [Deltaproteobacteria bacterium]|jgi:diguanylate cyclase (GGDEF)-like protein|nr:diguanylate cyclase [Deltaproteobacteria bacterium]
MASIRNQLLAYFEEYAEDDAKLIQKLKDLIGHEGKAVYTYIFQILTNLDLPPVQAEEHWKQVISHSRDLSATMGREVNLRTAICDYFCSINKSLHNPKIIEIHLFEKTARSSTFDNLTGLLNRNAFDEVLAREMSRAKRHEANLTLLFFDIDDFKRVNDTHGHVAGDRVLQKVAESLMEEKRAEDIGARYGGEEITLLLPETNKADGWLIGERIRRKVEESIIDYEGTKIRVTLSGGLASFPIDAGEGLTLLKNADKAMYRAKSFGKNNISFYSMDKRRNIRVDHTAAVEIQELGIHEKPVLNAMTKSLSIGGVLLESSTPFESGARLQINMALGQGKPLLVIGSVLRSEKTGPGSHDISIAFIGSNREIRNEISSYLIRHLQDAPSPAFTPPQATL